MKLAIEIMFILVTTNKLNTKNERQNSIVEVNVWNILDDSWSTKNAENELLSKF